METSFDFTPPTPIGRGRPKLIHRCSPKSAGESNLELQVDRMTEQQLGQAIEIINEDPPTITVVDKNGHENQLKTEIIEILSTNETDNNTNQIRRSSRRRFNKSIILFGNPLTH